MGSFAVLAETEKRLKEGNFTHRCNKCQCDFCCSGSEIKCPECHSVSNVVELTHRCNNCCYLFKSINIKSCPSCGSERIEERKAGG